MVKSRKGRKANGQLKKGYTIKGGESSKPAKPNDAKPAADANQNRSTGRFFCARSASPH
ncbi:hypothetical protein KW548_10550 [Vibrio neptunius]|nr:hypothetical protein [Vibrio neptunius]QXX05650.1 hypothetical protein KW548_10550 [Vibrio neptunius]